MNILTGHRQTAHEEASGIFRKSQVLDLMVEED
jgi:hypothetical protein